MKRTKTQIAIGIFLVISGLVVAGTTVNLNVILAVILTYFGAYTLFAKEVRKP